MVLVRFGRHQNPMATVLKRYGVGTVDKYDRGIWISPADLEAIKEGMMAQRNKVVGGGDVAVPGTNMHNWVYLSQFAALFRKEE